ncbi:MAG: response regulator [SAR324 cluster bacterium]|nr:response regulator [SAR324 cluster bacterium]
MFPGIKSFGLFDVFQRVWKSGIPEKHPISSYKDDRIFGWRDNYVYKLPSGEVVALYDDITAAKQAEEELIKAKETAEAALLTKSRFLANMSHELRTPMNGVIGTAEILQYSQLDSSQQEMVKTIRVCGEHLLSIINDILDFSKSEAGAIQLVSVPLSLRKCLNQTLDMVGKNISGKPVHLSYAIDSAVSDMIQGDVTRLCQILINLIGNSIKFTQQGEVKIGLKLQPDTPSMLLFSVYDTGIGMSSTTQQNLFQPFSQGDSSRTRKYGGTGLGLAITKNLIELMGGAIWVDSEEAKGATFYFTIPYNPVVSNERSPAKSSSSVEPQAEKPVEDSIPLEIMVAEDDIANQYVMRIMLKKLGYEAQMVSTGIEVIKELERHTYDLIFMDMQMPEMNGVEATREIVRRWNVEQRPRIIALTANYTQSDMRECLDAGMDDYLSKPVFLETLHEKILQWGIPRATMERQKNK